MQTMNISLPEPVIEFVEKQIRAGVYTSASEYIAELVRADQKNKAQELLEQALLACRKEGAQAGTGRDWWESLRAEFIKRMRTRKPLTGA